MAHSQSEFKINQQVKSYHANLAKHPGGNPELKPDPRNFFALGDLHGNALKLLNFLVHINALEITSKEYDEIYKICITPIKSLTEKQLDRYDAIIEKAKFNPFGMLLLIGDETGDRSYNDYFTLKIIEKLSKEKSPLQILISNHGVEFVNSYETLKSFKPFIMSSSHTNSLIKLNELLNKFPERRKVIDHIINHCYKPSLHALTCTLSENKKSLTLFSHAGIGLRTIQAIAKKLKVPYAANSAVELSETIKNIDIAFQKYVEKNEVHKLYNPEIMMNGYYGTLIDQDEYPFEFLMWNRTYKKYNFEKNMHDHIIDRPEKLPNGDTLYFSHGHDEKDSFPTLINLDYNNNLGKLDKFISGALNFFMSQDMPMLRNVLKPVILESKSSFFQFHETKEEKPTFVGVYNLIANFYKTNMQPFINKPVKKLSAYENDQISSIMDIINSEAPKNESMARSLLEKIFAHVYFDSKDETPPLKPMEIADIENPIKKIHEALAYSLFPLHDLNKLEESDKLKSIETPELMEIYCKLIISNLEQTKIIMQPDEHKATVIKSTKR